MKIHKHSTFRCLVLGLTLTVCATGASAQEAGRRVDPIVRGLRDAQAPGVFVVAHRGCWREAAENSVAAVDACVAMGVDIMELDVRRTKDGALVMIHDSSVDRMTNGKGKVEKLTLAEIKALRLRTRDGGASAALTDMQVLTLRELLDVVRGRIVVHLDLKGGASMWADAWDAVTEMGMSDQVLMKITEPHDHEAWRTAPFLGAPLVRSRIVEADGPAPVQICALREHGLIAHTLMFRDIAFIEGTSEAAAKCGGRLWVATEEAHYAGGLDDALAECDPDAVWGRLIGKGFTILETDDPRRLIAYLKHKGLKK